MDSENKFTNQSPLDDKSEGVLGINGEENNAPVDPNSLPKEEIKADSASAEDGTSSNTEIELSDNKAPEQEESNVVSEPSEESQPNLEENISSNEAEEEPFSDDVNEVSSEVAGEESFDFEDEAASETSFEEDLPLEEASSQIEENESPVEETSPEDGSIAEFSEEETESLEEESLEESELDEAEESASNESVEDSSETKPVKESPFLPEGSPRGEAPFQNESGKKTMAKAEKAYFGKTRGLDSNASFKHLLDILRNNGKNYLSQKLRQEEKAYDDTFIKKLEEGFEAIDSIILNPRTFIKENPELVDAGRAKKINSQSIVHLASHTQYVYDVDEKNNVTPMKILTVNSDVDYQIYENRFVWCLINKAALFIEKRFHYIKDHGETRDSEVLYVRNNTEINGAKYEFDSRIVVSVPSADNGNAEHNADLLVRLGKLRERAAYYRKSSFADQMKGAKVVTNPIHRTNMIVKEPHYHACYELWNFLDSYSQLGVHFDVKETERPFTEDDYSDVLTLVGASYASLRSSLSDRIDIGSAKIRTKAIDPKVNFSLEDETYGDGRFLFDQFKEGYPAAKEDEENRPFEDCFPTFEEAKKDRQNLEERFAEYGVKKHLIDMAIEEDKARQVALEAEERKKAMEEATKAEEEEKARIKAIEDAKRAEEEAKEAALREQLEAEEEEKLRQTRLEQRKKALEAKGFDLSPIVAAPSTDTAPTAEPAIEVAPAAEETPKKKYKPVKVMRDISGRVITAEEKAKAKKGEIRFRKVSKEEIAEMRKKQKEAEEASSNEKESEGTPEQ